MNLLSCKCWNTIVVNAIFLSDVVLLTEDIDILLLDVVDIDQRFVMKLCKEAILKLRMLSVCA